MFINHHDICWLTPPPVYQSESPTWSQLGHSQPPLVTVSHFDPETSCTYLAKWSGTQCQPLVCCIGLHLTLDFYVLYCLRTIVPEPAPGLLYFVVDHRLSLYQYHTQCGFLPWLVFLLPFTLFPATSMLSGYQPQLLSVGGKYYAVSFHEGPSSSSSLNFCCLRYSLSKSPLVAIFLIFDV